MAAKDESYQEVISQLDAYIKKVEESCTTLESAAKDCVDNTDNDPAAARSSENLSKAIAKIQEQMPNIRAVMQAMQAQLERIHQAASEAE